MNALFFNNHGGIENLKFGSFEEPILPDDNHIIIKVHYSSLNHLDLWVLNSWKGLNIPLPHIGGADILGSVADLGKTNDSEFKTGDLVCINPGYLKTNSQDIYSKSGKQHLSKNFGIFGETCKGGFAEFVCIPKDSVHIIPTLAKQDETKLVATLLVGLTAYRMLQARAKLIAGETILIIGATGGLNSFSLKLAKYFGATVIAATSNEEKVEFCRSLGADHVINYSENPNWSKKVKELTNGFGAQVVIDNVGAQTMNESIRSCSMEGRIITVGNTSGHELKLDNRLIFSKQISIIGSTMGSYEDFTKVLQIILTHKLYAPIHKIYPLQEGARGYEDLKFGKQMGKVVLTPLT